MVKGSTATPTGLSNNKKAAKSSASTIVKSARGGAFPSSPSSKALDPKAAIANAKKNSSPVLAPTMPPPATGNNKKAAAPAAAAAAAPATPVTPPSTARDVEFLRHAVRLSRDHMRAGAGGPFGAVVVKDGEVIAEGWNQVTSTCDPTAHGEVVAIRRACAKLKTFSLQGCVMYTSCEPCPMCLGSIYWARLDRIVFANTRDQAAAIGFDDAHIYDEIPMHISERKMHHTHIPLDEAWHVFQEYHSKEDKTHY